MASLSEVYGNPQNPKDTISRNKLGYVLMVIGGVLSFLGVIVGTTGVLMTVFNSTFDQVQLFGGIFTGIGVISLIGGMLYSVPDKSTLEIKAGITGVLLSIFGVVWFAIQFPNNWNIFDLSTVALVGFSYASGMIVLLIITFHAVVNYRLKSTEKFTVTHRFEKTHTSEQKQMSRSKEENTTSDRSKNRGGIGLIGNLSSDSRETYGPRTPMTKEDRERHSVARDD